MPIIQDVGCINKAKSIENIINAHQNWQVAGNRDVILIYGLLLELTRN